MPCGRSASAHSIGTGRHPPAAALDSLDERPPAAGAALVAARPFRGRAVPGTGPAAALPLLLRSLDPGDHPGPHAGLAASAPEEARAGLLEHLELGVALVDAQVLERQVLGVLERRTGHLDPLHGYLLLFLARERFGFGAGGRREGLDAGRGPTALPPCRRRLPARVPWCGSRFFEPPLFWAVRFVPAGFVACTGGLAPPLLVPLAFFAATLRGVGSGLRSTPSCSPWPPLLVRRPWRRPWPGLPPLALGPTRVRSRPWSGAARPGSPWDARPWPWRPRRRRSRRGGSGCRARPGTSSG